MSLKKTVEVEITVDSMTVNFADPAISIQGTVKGSLIGKQYSVALPSDIAREWAAKLQPQAVELMEKTGALWSA